MNKVSKKNKIIGSIMMFSTSIIWGLAFVAQEKGADAISPMWFTFFRNVIATFSLLPIIAFNSKKTPSQQKKPLTKKEKRFFLIGAVLCGFSLFIASYLQQLGLTLGTPAGKAGFITALYIVIVPIMSVVLKKKIKPLVWLSVALSVVGLYFLCVTDSSISKGDLVVLLCSFCYSAQIMFIDYFSPHMDGVKLSCGQFFFCAVFALIASFIIEPMITLQNLKDGLIPLLYAGLFSSGVAFTLQIVGQKKLNNPTVASLLMSFESVFSVVFSMIIFHRVPTAQEAIGCVIMFIAVIIAQI